MPFVVKATYRGETRKFTFTSPYFPTYQDLYHQLYRVFSVGHSFYLSTLLFWPQAGARILQADARVLIGTEAHSAAEYDALIAPYRDNCYPNGRLNVSVYDETPHKAPGSGSSIHPIPPVPPIPFFAPPPPPLPSQPPTFPQTPKLSYDQSMRSLAGESCGPPDTPKTSKETPRAECCSVSEAKREVKSLLDNFVHDFARVMATTFGEDVSFLDPFGSPSLTRSATPIGKPVADLEASLPIPGSFIQPRPQSPLTVDEEDVEKSQSPPRLEPTQTLHPNIWCDFCGKQIRGLRFKCQECAGYDLCANCIVDNQALDKHNAGQPRIHAFSTISPPAPKDTSTPPSTFTAPPQPVPSTPNPPEPVIHRDVWCDICQNIIVGNRHKCLDCPDYDLCDQCIKNAPVLHPVHAFVKIEIPGRVIVHTVTSTEEPSSPVMHNAHCNLCDSKILGERYKCTNCPDFDTCAGCFAITPEQHPGHIFVRIVRPTDLMMPRTYTREYHPAVCDCCKGSIIGVRYKCMHTDCPDFDLCQNCEALPIYVHPVSHPFLKIKTADTRLPAVHRRPNHDVQLSPPGPAPVLEVPRTVTAPLCATHTSPPVSPITERLHAIRMQAERRLSARMQQLGNHSPEALEVGAAQPVVGEQLLQEHKEALQSANGVDQPASVVINSPSTESTCRAESSNQRDTNPPQTPSSENILVQTPKPQMTQKTPSLFGSPFTPLSPLQATFISDTNIPDGHFFPMGGEFVKSWRVKNSGSQPWGNGTELVYVGGMRLGAFEDAPTAYNVGVVTCDAEIDICARDMKAPDFSGRFVSHWRLRDPQGRLFGPKMWCDIEVLQTESDHKQHDSLVNSEVVMPATISEQQVPSASVTSAPSSPITSPTSVIACWDGDETSSVGSVSLVDHNDSDWDDVPEVPVSPLSSPRVPPPHHDVNDAEYLVLYDSSDSEV